LKLSTYGYRMFICGDLLELLYHCAFHLQKVKMDLIPLNKFYSPNTTFEENEKCFLLRNPHYSRNEVAVLLNHKEKEGSERQKYFGHLTGVLMYNPITQLADRLGGADYDGDSIVVIPAKYAAKAAQKIIKKNNDKHCALKYPVIKIPGLSADKKKMVYDEKVKCLFNTFDSRVGLISNNAFVEAFDLYKESKYDSQQDAIAYYTIVNGLEIDSAKQGIKPKMPLKPDKNNGSLFLKFKKDLNESKYFPKETYDKILNIDDNHIIFKLLKDVVTLKRTESSRSKFKTKINYDIVTDQHIIDICAIYSAYNLFLYQINQYRKYLTKKQINFQNETPLICKIKEILKSNGIEDYVSFCNNFARKIDSMEVRYNYYNADKKFHYLKDDESKREFIKDLGLTESLTEEEEKVIFNFKKEGYMLLYLLIIFITQVIKNGNKKISFKEYNINICLSNMISSFQKNLSAKRYFKRKDIAEDYFFRLLNHNKQIDPNLIVNDKESKLMEIKKNVYNLAEKINYEFGKYDDLIECTEYNCFSKKGLNKMYEKVCEFLKEKAKDIPLDAYLFIGKINESDFVFDVMSEQLEIYLKNLGDRNEK